MQHELPQYPSIGLSELPPLHAPDVRTRSTTTRGFLFAGLLIAFIAPFALAGFVGAQIVDGSGYASDAEYRTAMDHAQLLGYLFCLPLHMLFLAKVAPKVSYRSRDAFMVFIPIYSYVFVAKVLWRLTALTDRPWEHRPEEYVADDHR